MPLLDVPVSASIFSFRISFSTSRTACAGLKASSRSMTWILRPLMPPALLIRLTATFSPQRPCSPSAASGPLNVLTWPILMGAAAHAFLRKNGPVLAVTAPTAASFRKSRLELLLVMRNLPTLYE